VVIVAPLKKCGDFWLRRLVNPSRTDGNRAFTQNCGKHDFDRRDGHQKSLTPMTGDISSRQNNTAEFSQHMVKVIN
jgi:hypothetical protein